MAWLWRIGWVRRLRRRSRRPVQALLGPSLTGYIKFVIKTSKIAGDPPDFADRAHSLHPSILAFWHGQFVLIPGLYPRDIPTRVMVARHDDAEGFAGVVERFAFGLIRGAGAGSRRRDRGGASAARRALSSLKEGYGVAMTADVPPGPARRCGRGIVLIASMSGRPIVPIAVATSRYVALNTWSRMTVNLPFAKIGLVMGDPILVPKGARAEELEAWRQRVETALNEVTAKAYAGAGADPARATPTPVVSVAEFQLGETLFEPLTYGARVTAEAAEGQTQGGDFSVEDIKLLGRSLALELSPADVSALRVRLFADARAWATLLSLAEETRLLAAVAKTLHGRQLVPPEARTADAVTAAQSPAAVLRDRVAAHHARRQVLRARLMELVTALNAAGIEPLLIKGAQSLWTGTPDWRYQVDLDLLIEEADAAAAQAAVIAIGYGRAAGNPVRDRRHHLDPLFRHDLPGCVEIHRRAGNRYAEPLLPSAELFEASVPSVVDGARARLLPPSLHILQALLHHHVGHSADARGLISLKGLYEFASALTALDAAERRTLELRAAKNVRVAAALDLWIAAAASLFAMKVEEPFRLRDDALARWANVLARMGGALRPGWKYPGYREEIGMACAGDRMRRIRPSASFLGRQVARLQVVGSLLPKPPN